MEQFNELISAVGGFVWGPVMLILLVGTGVLFTIRLAFLQFRFLPFALKQAFTSRDESAGHEGDVSHFGALMTALSATIGTGNIAGVATAVVLGGPGAIFWMWVTAIFGLATKYAEAILAVKYRIVNEKGEMSGGPMYYLERGCKMKWLAMLFALFAIIASFGIGSSVQSNSVAASIEASLHIEPWITGVILTVLTAIVVLGGIKSISRAASVIVPIMAVVYVIGGLFIIFSNFDLLVPSIKSIISDAFTGKAVAGGVVYSVIRYGVARGVFSNEAGMGSAPIAAAAAKTDHPGRQAMISMTGTFLDTIVVCSITGIVLVMGNLYMGGETGAALTTTTFEAMLPGFGGALVTFGLVFFAYSTILGWCYYGEKCATYLFGEGALNIYRIVYVATVMMGTVLSLDLVWNLADTFNGLMAIPNLIGLLILSGVVVKETKDFLDKRKSGELK
ncbi:alanine/glycine:cation symporter family protein [Taylorella equigenitalis]|uniref:Sodium/glycine symporter GlyP n=2 Tax=Taylorella equigenitalis TaxID=29575 RepID=A0A654KH20_TAYEM|nr:sodium:alanine symporter family protein [Taylorella equigenitalis]ADU91146.1 Sodium/glycine symporter GlyP [Taylorella equigenitalis MCE9]AFN36251.1 putative sodium/alanine symporter [Taylorella equigenitalis ATCC 35865]ASY38123.1 sodium:alanine symporter family protein [Taylorella equigenitalis]ASY39650.1 sodium:alanine symporter family protein [Taylorella equigenitalis]ASY42587.1 sodium:alanine symporter family protein [Taylorella equigenitalis]